MCKDVLLSFKEKRVYTSLKKIIYKFYGSTHYFHTRGTMSKIFLKVIKEDCTNLLEKTNNKTLLLCGRNDVQTPLWQAAIIKSKLTNCKLIILENARHAIHIQAKERVLAEIKKFLK